MPQRDAERLSCLAATPDSPRAREDQRLKVLISASFNAGRGYYGSPRVHDDLIEAKRKGGLGLDDMVDTLRQPYPAASW